MSYYISKTVQQPFDEVEQALIANLKEQGFGIVTEINLQNTFKNKLAIDFRKYKILGACNPKFAHEAIGIDAMVGVLLPCNVCLQEKEDGLVEVFAINTLEAMKLSNNLEMESIGELVNKKITFAIDQL